MKDVPQPTGKVLESAGFAPASATDPSRVLTSPGFQDALQETGLRAALLRQGVTPQKIAAKIDLLLEASDPDGDDDFTAIDKGLKHATAIYGVLDEKPKSNQTNTYNFIFSPETKNAVEEIEAKIKARLLEHDQTN